MKNENSFEKTIRQEQVPERKNNLKSNPKKIRYKWNGIWLTKCSELKTYEIKINVLYEIYNDGRMKWFTDDLIFGPRQEIIFDPKLNQHTIKNLEKLRAKWRKNHPFEADCESEMYYVTMD